jgi:hypothetical protein
MQLDLCMKQSILTDCKLLCCMSCMFQTTPTMALILFYNRMGFNWGVTPMPYGPEWRLCRKLLHEQFNHHEAVHYATQQEASTRVMLRDLLNAPGDFRTHIQQ